MKTVDPASIGLGELSSLEGSAFPNPTTGDITISVDANGEASLKVADVAGRVVLNMDITFANGRVEVDMSGLDPGVYVFNITLDNGQTSQFNVVKK